MDPKAASGAVFFVLAAIVAVPRLWRNDPFLASLYNIFLPLILGATLARAYRRHMAASTALFALLSLLLAFEPSVSATLSRGWFLTLLVATFTALISLMFSIMLFNRPRSLVPPAFRDEAGLVSVWTHRDHHRAVADQGGRPPDRVRRPVDLTSIGEFAAIDIDVMSSSAGNRAVHAARAYRALEALYDMPSTTALKELTAVARGDAQWVRAAQLGKAGLGLMRRQPR